MNILVLEWDISRFSGRMASMMRFADAFKELGHHVRVCSNWTGAEIKEKKDLFHYHQVKELVLEDFSWDLQRNYSFFPPAWKDFDFIFCPYVSYGHLSELPGGKPTVCWWISKQHGWSSKTLEFWTNSQTTLKMLAERYGMPNIHVIIPPYDYSLFRREALNWESRPIDIAYACRIDEDKNIGEFIETVNEYHLKGILLFLIKTSVEFDTALKIRNEHGIPFAFNLDKEDLSSILGKTKIYFHPSKVESCSIAIYEAMNAGCYVVARDVGAAREQIGMDAGEVYGGGGAEIVHSRLQNGFVIDESLKRGLRFGKATVMPSIARRLEEIERRLK